MGNAFSATLTIDSPQSGKKIVLHTVDVKGEASPADEVQGKIRWETTIEKLYTTETINGVAGILLINKIPASNASFGKNKVIATVVTSTSSCSEGKSDTVKPVIQLDPLRECFTSNDINVHGKATDNCKIQSVTINGIAVFTGEDGSFSTNLNLPDGIHTVVIEAKDTSDNDVQKPVGLRVDTQPPQLISLTPSERETNVRATAPVIAEYSEELSSGEIIVTNASGRSVRQGRRIIYEHLPFESDQAYNVQIVNVRDTCGCAEK